MLGSIERGHVVALLQALAAGDGAALLQTVEHLSQQAPDYEGLLAELLVYLQQIAIAQTVPDAVDEQLDERDAVVELAGRMAAGLVCPIQPLDLATREVKVRRVFLDVFSPHWRLTDNAQFSWGCSIAWWCCISWDRKVPILPGIVQLNIVR